MESTDLKTAIGLMSGTSMDGIDVALIRTDGQTVHDFGPTGYLKYGEGTRQRLSGVLGGTGDVASVEEEITLLHVDAVRAFLKEASLVPADIDVVGFHGHTIRHDPAARITNQLGDGKQLARLVGIPVINDFRSNDMAHGGQGAPLAPLYHAALAADVEKPVAILNIGGVANVTFIYKKDELIAFDTGPGNALLDDWARHTINQAHDEDGRLAARGTVDIKALQILLDDPYFDAPPPKSLDRGHFSLKPVADLTAEDGAATLAIFTAEAVARAKLHGGTPRHWYVCGGGRKNPVLMKNLAGMLPEGVSPVEELGWDGDALESQAFAFLAVRSLKGLPLTLPGTTGVSEPVSGGVLHDPD